MALPTFNGWNIVALPNAKFASVDFTSTDTVGQNISPWTAEAQNYDWQSSFLSATVTIPPQQGALAAAWAAFPLACRGPLNVFELADSSQAAPFGSALGTPVVNGSGQAGYSIATSGWTPNETGLLLFGDYITIMSAPINSGDVSIPRLYRVTAEVSSDSSGDATISIWPQIRESPATGTAIITRDTSGLFRLTSGQSKWNKNFDTTMTMSFSCTEAL